MYTSADDKDSMEFAQRSFAITRGSVAAGGLRSGPSSSTTQDPGLLHPTRAYQARTNTTESNMRLYR